MHEIIAISMAILFIVIVTSTSRYFYMVEVKKTARKLKASHQISPLELNYSFEQMIYFHSLPSNIPIIKNAKIENLSIVFSYRSFVFHRLQGIKVYVKNGKESVLLAYLATDDFRFPTLDVLQKEGNIDAAAYLKIATYRLMHPKTLQEITEEVYNQMRIGRYQTTK